MKRSWLAAVAALALYAPPAAASAADDLGTHGAFTLAVYGDAPYGAFQGDTAEFDATPAFINSVNADPDVSTVIHVGDIHSGKQFCTEDYDRSIAALWSHYADPLVYTPGDNEWTDCHKAGEGGGTYDPSTGQINYVLDPATGQPADYAAGNPIANLALIRSIFFSDPGHTLGSGSLKVLSQAQLRDRAHPTDAQFVENVLWQRRGFVFVSINVPGGSNNDADPWYGAPSTAAQQNEAAQRTAADVRWLNTAFRLASDDDAAGVVVITQADMWDLDGKTPAHLTNYEPIVSSLATHTSAFGKPVLLFTGDSHTYRSDNPLVQGAACTGDAEVCSFDAWTSHPYYNVANFHRIVVHGSTFPLEWLKLTVAPGAHNPTTATSFGPFSWTRMPQV
jgi:hypothetical protein